MIYVPVEKIKEFKRGDKIILAKDIKGIDGRILLRWGCAINSKVLKLLTKYGISSIYIEDKRTDDIVIKDVISESLRTRAINIINDILVKIEYTLKIENLKIKWDKIEDLAADIIREIRLKKDLSVNMMDIKTVDEYTAYHCVNVCILSLLIAKTYSFKYKDMFSLALGTILHDLGKAKVPKKILYKPGKLTAEEFEIIKKHPLYGKEILETVYKNDPDILIPVYMHHEKLNGKGYPFGIKGNSIHLFAKITSICDVYDALTSNRCYKQKADPKITYSIIEGDTKKCFDYDIFERFKSIIPLYPIGSLVKLSTGFIGIIIKNNHNLDRPVIRYLKDPLGRDVKPEEVDLAKEKNINILTFYK